VVPLLFLAVMLLLTFLLLPWGPALVNIPTDPGVTTFVGVPSVVGVPFIVGVPSVFSIHVLVWHSAV